MSAVNDRERFVPPRLNDQETEMVKAAERLIMAGLTLWPAVVCWAKTTSATRIILVALVVCLVAHTGFEPVISALRGRRPRPLDECARWRGC